MPFVYTMDDGHPVPDYDRSAFPVDYHPRAYDQLPLRGYLPALPLQIPRPRPPTGRPLPSPCTPNLMAPPPLETLKHNLFLETIEAMCDAIELKHDDDRDITFELEHDNDEVRHNTHRNNDDHNAPSIKALNNREVVEHSAHNDNNRDEVEHYTHYNHGEHGAPSDDHDPLNHCEVHYNHDEHTIPSTASLNHCNEVERLTRYTGLHAAPSDNPFNHHKEVDHNTHSNTDEHRASNDDPLNHREEIEHVTHHNNAEDNQPGLVLVIKFASKQSP